MRTSLAAALAIVLAFGCTDQPLPTASSDSPVVGAAFSASGKGGAVVTQTVDIDPFGVGTITSGTATLTRNAKGLWLTGQSNDLVEGDAYTVWAAIFDNPQGCAGGPGACGLGDLGVRQAQATISNFGGFVVDDDPEDFTFDIHLSRHDASRQTLGGLGRSGIDNPYRAEVHFIFRSHGLAETDPGDLADQTSMVGAFCNLPSVGCEDQGVAMFSPPGPPGQG
jgi:hypothetical protein